MIPNNDNDRERDGLDLSRLAKARDRGGRLIAQCPACAAQGADSTGDHLVIFDEGRGKWGCVAYPGDKEHRREIAAAVGQSRENRIARRMSPPPRRATPPPAPRVLQLPPLIRIPTIHELDHLARLRGLPAFAGLELATRAGMLRCSEMSDAGEIVTAWILLDSSRRCAQARRLDGKPWRGINAKAKTLPGSQAAWPIGAADIGSKPYVALCEGGPDTLAAWTLAWWHGRHKEIAPICICGAGNRLPPDAYASLEGKGIWTFPHRDPAGARAQARWTEDLRAAGAAWIKPFDLTPHKDLNDWLAAAARTLAHDFRTYTH